MNNNLYKIPFVITSMAKVKYCKCGHREDQHLPATAKRQGSKEHWNAKIRYKGQCGFCEISSQSCRKFREDKK